MNFKNKYSRVFLLMALLVLGTADIPAQDSDGNASGSYYFVYIAQGSLEEMPSNKIEGALWNVWNHGTQNEGPIIFYLSRGTQSPIIVKANLNGSAGLDQDKQVLQSKLIDVLSEGIQYSVDGAYDKKRILELLQENDFLDKNGNPRYKETNFYFHVGQDYWDSGNHEMVIASLFFELDIARFIKDGYEFHYNVYCPKKLSWKESEGVFGFLNPDEARRYINLAKEY